MEYWPLLIPAALGALLGFMWARQRKVNALHKATMDELDQQISEGQKKLETLVDFAKKGYRCQDAEHISHVGDGYLITKTDDGKESIILPPKERKH